MSYQRQHRRIGWKPLAALAAAVALASCSLAGSSGNLAPTSVQTLEYYPRLVKGYQNSYPQRRVLVLMPVDDREFKDPTAADHNPLDGNPAIGVTLSHSQDVLQRLYSPPLAPLLQKALDQAVEEAGMVPLTSDVTVYTPGAPPKMAEDYVLQSQVTKAWVKKQRGVDSRYGPTWYTTAEFAINAKLFKPPFSTAFWEGVSSASYDDPPMHGSLAPEDETGIYDDPGQVLSIALTRSVAGIFKREDLHTLVTEDIVPRRN